MTKQKIYHITGNYEEWLIHSLRNKKEAAAYLQVALSEYQNDGVLEAFLLALRHVAEATRRFRQTSNKNIFKSRKSL